MAAVGKLYGKVFLALFNKEIDWLDDTIKVALCTSSYTPDQDVHDYFDDVTDEITGSGYSAGGATLINKTITYTSGTNTITLDADDLSWTSATITARTAVVYDASPVSAATRPLICYQQESTDIGTTAGEFILQWAASGIVSIVVA